jgi:hypothetical protein
LPFAVAGRFAAAGVAFFGCSSPLVFFAAKVAPFPVVFRVRD